MARNGNVLNTISSLYQSLTKTEKKIADTILMSPDLVVQCPLSEIAEHLDVGEATFVRFAVPWDLRGLAILNWNFPLNLPRKTIAIIRYWKRILLIMTVLFILRKNCRVQFLMSLMKRLIYWTSNN